MFHGIKCAAVKMGKCLVETCSRRHQLTKTILISSGRSPRACKFSGRGTRSGSG